MRILAILILLPILAGCSNPVNDSSAYPPSQKYWTKQNYTRAAFNSDNYQCLQSSIAVSRRDSPAISGDMGDFIQLSNQNNLFSACMAAKGYTLETGAVTMPNAQPIPEISNLKVAYCLGIVQSALSESEDYMQKNNKSNDSTTLLFYNMKKKIAQGLIGYLPDTQGASASPEIASEIDKGHKDQISVRQRAESGKDKYMNCTMKCNQTQKVTTEATEENCSQKCDQYMSDKVRKIKDCIYLEKQLGLF